MTRVRLEFENGKWKEYDNSSRPITKNDFYFDRQLLKKLKNIKKVTKSNWDFWILIDGGERVGKSTLGMQIGWYLSNQKMTLNNFCKGLEELADKIDKLPDNSVIVIDEAGTMFNSSDGQTKWMKALIKVMEVVGQRYFTFVLCLPRFFKLKDDVAVARSEFLLHCYKHPQTWERGHYVYYGKEKKAALYDNCRKNHGSYKNPKPDFKPMEFPSWTPPFFQEYEDTIKKATLQETVDALRELGGNKGKNTKAGFEKKQRDTEAKAYYFMKEVLKAKPKEMEKVYGHAYRTIMTRIKDYKDEYLEK